MIRKLTYQFGWKVLSFFLAALLWLLVVNYEDPTVTRSFNGIEVETRNANAITSQNKAIEYKSGQTVDIVVSGRRSIIDKLKSSDIKSYADLRNVSITGAVDIEFTVKDGVDVIYKSPADMRIAWEDVIKQQKEIQYYFSGDVAEGYVALEPELTPNRLQISGPQSKVNQVSSIILPVNVSDASSDLTLYVEPQILDGTKNEVEGVAADIDKVQVRVPIQSLKAVEVVFKQSGEPDEGYALTEVKVDVGTLNVRGYGQYIEGFNQIIIDDIDLEGMTESTTRNVDLANYLPDGVYVYDESSMATVQLTIKPVTEKDVRIGTENIIIEGVPEGYEVVIDEGQDVVLTMKGIQEILDTVTIQSLEATLDIEAAQIVDAGTYEVPLSYTLPEGVQVEGEVPPVTVTLAETTTEDTTTPATTESQP